MPKFIYNKLIRDKISELAILDGAKLDFEHITGEKLITQLKKKIREEADEVQEATNNEDLVDELIDLQEIMDTILKNLGIDRETFTARKQAKREKRG
jgi:predicted house-cleaning noncanonical NTP pyrophosphatase (MazG superfamily)